MTTLPLSPSLAGRLAHEIRSPLNVLSGTLDQLGRDPGLSDTSAQLLQLARRSCDRLTRLSRRLEHVAAQGPEDRGPVPFERLRDWVERAREEAARRSVQLMLGELPELSALPGPLAHALEVAVDETVHNAIRHARARVEVLVEATDDGVRVVVSDDGGGLPEKLVGALPAFPEEHRGGLGLGLVLAHLYLCAVGGSLRLGADAVTVEVPRA